MANLKRAAMFGLDARVALTIFSVVSIIAVSNIYRVLTEININKVLAEASNIGGAVDDYHKVMNASIFDTVLTTLSADDKEKAAFMALVKNQDLEAAYQTKWNGPYLSMKFKDAYEKFFESDYRLVSLAKDTSTTCNNVKTNPCYVFLKLKDVDMNTCEDVVEEVTLEGYSTVYKTDINATTCDLFINVTTDYN